MNCNTCRFELSQCLDGRLPSGRRAIVMQHAADCAECATFWGELQAAQQLTLQLQKQHVSEGFREQLWDRIRAGEGTPDAVFHEPVPMMARVRYALTGAAAAAAVLLCATWMRGERPHNPHNQAQDLVAEKSGDGVDRRENRVVVGPARVVAQNDAGTVDPLPLFSSTQPLTAGLLAVEAAKGFEQRCNLANRSIAQIGPQAAATDAAMVRQAFANALEARDLGAALLELRDRERLSFRDADAYQDLRFAVSMLGQIRKSAGSVEAVRTIVAPALRSARLGNITRSISLPPSLDPRDDQDVLVHLNTVRPEVFPMLFVSFGPGDDICEDLGLFRKVGVFVLDDQCGRSYVAPRSLLEAGFGRLRILRSSPGAGAIHVEVEVDRK